MSDAAPSVQYDTWRLAHESVPSPPYAESRHVVLSWHDGVGARVGASEGACEAAGAGFR